MDRKFIYFLGSWSGNRNGIPPGTTFLRKHIEHLNTVKHSLAHIAIGYPDNPNESPKYTNFITRLKALDDGTPISVHQVANEGYSYGQYSKMFEQFKDQDFTHYIFMEDDYAPYIDHFDTILADMYDERHQKYNCGLLCGLVIDETGRYGKFNRKLHAGISNGITSREVLLKIREEFGHLIHTDPSMHRNAQVVWSQGFLRTGYRIQEYLDKYKSLYYQHAGNKLQIYGDHGEYLIVPMQFLEPEYGGLPLERNIMESGGHYQRLKAKAEANGQPWPPDKMYC
jgi:hypothetical protein